MFQKKTSSEGEISEFWGGGISFPSGQMELPQLRGGFCPHRYFS